MARQPDLFDDVECGVQAAPAPTDTITRIAKADLRLCCGMAARRDERLVFVRRDEDRFLFDIRKLRFAFTEPVLLSILDGKALPFGEQWIEVRR